MLYRWLEKALIYIIHVLFTFLAEATLCAILRVVGLSRYLKHMHYCEYTQKLNQTTSPNTNTEIQTVYSNQLCQQTQTLPKQIKLQILWFNTPTQTVPSILKGMWRNSKVYHFKAVCKSTVAEGRADQVSYHVLCYKAVCVTPKISDVPP